MNDRVNDSNYSNDKKGVKHVRKSLTKKTVRTNSEKTGDSE